MRKRHLLVVVIAGLLLLTIACSALQPLVGGLQTPAVLPSAYPTLPTAAEPDTIPLQETDETQQAVPAPVETVPPNCLGDEISPIGKAIAEEYDSTSYEQVMTWFCNGAEFEDILVALETEAQTGALAGEMLQMLADGFTWDDIWQTLDFEE